MKNRILLIHFIKLSDLFSSYSFVYIYILFIKTKINIYIYVYIGQIYFRPTIAYQELLPGVHVCDGQLEFKLDFKSGLNQARFGTGIIVEKNTSRYEEIMEKQLNCVEDNASRGDEIAIKNRLISAGTFGKLEDIKYLIRTCHVTKSLASEVLCELAKEGKNK